MESLEQIRKAAYELLIVEGPAGQTERWLWDRACRIVRHIEAISRLPDLQEIRESVDLFALETAGYLSDSGLPVYAATRETGISLALLELGRPELRDFSLQTIREKLTSIKQMDFLEKVCRIVSESDNRFTKLPEAQILSDARNLEDMGLVGLVQDIRRCLLQGKGVSAILESWKRKIDYRYWEARLKESFHFPSVRKIAQKRFSAAESCMRSLEMEDFGQDLKNIVLESLGPIS